MANTYGSELSIVCPICWGTMTDLWDVDPHKGPFPMSCEHCDGALLITEDSKGQWLVQIK